MIKVGNKELEIGDTANFICGGSDVVEAITHKCSGIHEVTFSKNVGSIQILEDGTANYRNHSLLNILSIVKSPKPEFKFIEVVYNPQLEEDVATLYESMDDLNDCKDEFLKDIGIIKISVLDNKIKSLVVVDNK